MIRFFAFQGNFINKPKETTKFTPWMLAFMSRFEDIILYFLNHPQTNLRQTNVWGDNIFHIIFLVSGERGVLQNRKKLGRIDVLNLIFQPEYFSKVHDLLIAKNKNGETPMDFALREKKNHIMTDQIIRLLESRIAMVEALKGLSKENINKIFDLFLSKDESGETPLDRLDKERNTPKYEKTISDLKKKMSTELELSLKEINQILYDFSKYPILPLVKNKEIKKMKNSCERTIQSFFP